MTCSPLAINMLLHFYAIRSLYRDEHPDYWPPAQRALLADMLSNGLVTAVDKQCMFVTTDAGRRVVHRLLDQFCLLVNMHETTTKKTEETPQ